MPCSARSVPLFVTRCSEAGVLIYAGKWEGGFEEDVRAGEVRESQAGNAGQGNASVSCCSVAQSCPTL